MPNVNIVASETILAFTASNNGKMSILHTASLPSTLHIMGATGSLFSVSDQMSGSLFTVTDVSGLPVLDILTSNDLILSCSMGITTGSLAVTGSFCVAPFGTKKLEINNTGFGWFGRTPVARQTVSGSKGSNEALGSLLHLLQASGFIIDSTT